MSTDYIEPWRKWAAIAEEGARDGDAEKEDGSASGEERHVCPAAGSTGSVGLRFDEVLFVKMERLGGNARRDGMEWGKLGEEVETRGECLVNVPGRSWSHGSYAHMQLGDGYCI